MRFWDGAIGSCCKPIPLMTLSTVESYLRLGALVSLLTSAGRDTATDSFMPILCIGSAVLHRVVLIEQHSLESTEDSFPYWMEVKSLASRLDSHMRQTACASSSRVQLTMMRILAIRGLLMVPDQRPRSQRSTRSNGRTGFCTV